jgi:hypothetical protein
LEPRRSQQTKPTKTGEIEFAAGSFRGTWGGNQHRIGAIEFGKYLLQVIDLGQINILDVRLVRITGHVVLVIILGWIKLSAGLDLGDDGGVVDVRLVELGDIGFGNAGLLGVRRENR